MTYRLSYKSTKFKAYDSMSTIIVYIDNIELLNLPMSVRIEKLIEYRIIHNHSSYQLLKFKFNLKFSGK